MSDPAKVWTVNGATRLHIIVGDPIAQVKSPEGMTGAFQRRGVNAIVVPIHVTTAELPGLLGGIGLARNLDGIIVTVPHKFDCYRHCATTSDRGHFLRAVNIIRRTRAGGWHGEMLDGVSFVAAMRNAGVDPKGRRALLIGAGGAGSAMALALVEAGVGALAIHDGDTARRDALVQRLSQHAKVPVTSGSPDPTGFDIVANATPAGMRPEDPLPVDVANLSKAMFCGCVITSPAVSPFIAAARRIGCTTTTGGDMYTAQQPLMLEFLMGAGT